MLWIWSVCPSGSLCMNICTHSDVFWVLLTWSLCSVCCILIVSLFSPQLGIRISLSHEKEPLGTGEINSRQTGNYSDFNVNIICKISISVLFLFTPKDVQYIYICGEDLRCCNYFTTERKTLVSLVLYYLAVWNHENAKYKETPHNIFCWDSLPFSHKNIHEVGLLCWLNVWLKLDIIIKNEKKMNMFVCSRSSGVGSRAPERRQRAVLCPQLGRHLWFSLQRSATVPPQPRQRGNHRGESDRECKTRQKREPDWSLWSAVKNLVMM